MQKVGVSTSGFTLIPGFGRTTNLNTIPEFKYAYPKTFEAAKNVENLVALRISFTNSETTIESLKGKISVMHGKISRKRSFRIKNEDKLGSNKNTFEVAPQNGNQDVMVLWIKDPVTQTKINLGSKVNFQLTDLLTQPEITGSVGKIIWTANLLFYNEVGEIDPKEAGIQVSENNFNFIAMADPQGGNPYLNNENIKTRMRIHNAFLEDSVGLINQVNCDPKFAMVIGDITDAQGRKEDFEQMHEFLGKSKVPLLYSIGNHETTYSVKLGPGYNMDGFSNYFAAQKAINGLDKLLYSFNLGQWHFVVWPDPLRNNFFETHPHYFDWLEKDLEKYKDRPTMFFQHVPIHPIGINPMISYTEDVRTKKEILSILKKFGNVKYVLSGHVHIPIKSSFKTAVSIDRIKFINLPAAGFRPRAFGEVDYNGGPSQGVAIVEVNGKEAEITFKSVTLEEYKYPSVFPELDQELYSLEFQEKWEIPASNQFINGSFEDRLNGWGRRFIYMEDLNPSNICKSVRIPGTRDHALYLFTKIRSYHKPGQDRWPQNLNRIYQALNVTTNSNPTIRFKYQVDQRNTNKDALCGAFVLVEGYAGVTKRLNIMYSLGKAWYHNEDPNVDPRIVIDLGTEYKGWHQASLNVAEDFNTYVDGNQYNELKVDRLFITLGTWTGNDGHDKSYGVHFDDFVLEMISEASNVNGVSLNSIRSDQQWYRKTKHVAGEHWYIQDNPTKFT